MSTFIVNYMNHVAFTFTTTAHFNKIDSMEFFAEIYNSFPNFTDVC